MCYFPFFLLLCGCEHPASEQVLDAFRSFPRRRRAASDLNEHGNRPKPFCQADLSAQSSSRLNIDLKDHLKAWSRGMSSEVHRVLKDDGVYLCVSLNEDAHAVIEALPQGRSRRKH